MIDADLYEVSINSFKKGAEMFYCIPSILSHGYFCCSCNKYAKPEVLKYQIRTNGFYSFFP